jgi:hypothetical protein
MTGFESAQAKEALLNTSIFDMRDVARLNTQDLAETLLNLAFMGRVPLMRTLLDHRGKTPVVFDDIPDSPYATLNGQMSVLDRRLQLRYIAHPGDLKSLFSIVHECDMKGLLEPGQTYPLLLRDIDKAVKRSRFAGGVFTGALPDLRADVLSQPELAIALQEEASGPVTPDAYRPLLCWASKDMVRQFPERLRVLTPFQTVNNKVSMQDWKANYKADDSVEAALIKVGISLTSHNTEFAEFLFAAMAPAIAKLGLPDCSGRVLCETTTDFLLSFPTVNHSASNDEVAREFVSNYCPFEIIATQTAQICARDFGHKLRNFTFEKSTTTEYRYGTNELFEMLGHDNPLRGQVLNMMRKEQWLGLVKNFNSASASVKTLLALRDTLGIDNTGLPVHLTRNSYTQLTKAGYRFADETKVFECADDLAVDRYHFNNRSTTVLLEFDGADWQPPYADQMPARMVQDIFIKQYQQIMSTNLWPAPIPKPVSVKEALDLLVVHDTGIPMPRENTALALRAYLATAGLEACMQAATTEHWERLMVVFPKEDFKPHIKTLPHKARGLLLEDEMGL